MDENTKKLIEDNRLDGIIRLTKSEYPKALPKKLTVFVVSPTTTKVGKYVLPKVLKFGTDGRPSTFPKLTFKKVFMGQVFKVTDEHSIFDLKKRDFDYSLEKIKKPEALFTAIKRKYGQTRPGLDFSKVKVSKIEIKNLKYFEYAKQKGKGGGARGDR